MYIDTCIYRILLPLAMPIDSLTALISWTTVIAYFDSYVYRGVESKCIAIVQNIVNSKYKYKIKNKT